MLYLLFLALAVAYNWKKFRKERFALIESLMAAKSATHREMILSHYYYVFVFEGFLAFIVAHLITEKAFSIGLWELGVVYLVLVFLGFLLYRYFVRYLELQTGLELEKSFRQYLSKELRVNFALVLMPIIIYSIINWTFLDSVYEEWGSLWFIGILMNVIFVSVLTIVCTVVIMLKLIPNREITEPEYLKIINHRLEQINIPKLRVRWIETDVKNAFVVGLKLLSFSNQTMFIGKRLRTMLTLEEFDAVIAHELGHVANRHVHKRVIDLIKNFISVVLGIGFIMFLILGLSFLYWGEDAIFHTKATGIITAIFCLGWLIFNYVLLFDGIRSQEFEADAFAVMELGVDYETWRSTLEKLSAPEDLPDYLIGKVSQGKKSGTKKWFSKYFSTHPDLHTRFSFLQKKIQEQLPFNYYVSSSQRVRNYLSVLLQWKVAIPLTSAFALVMVWTSLHVRQGLKTVAWIQQATSEEILNNKDLESRINSSPNIIGHSLMYHIVIKQDPKLIDYFLKQGADKGKTLIYIGQTGNFELLQRYYPIYQDQLSEEEFYMILRKTARANFTEGYRYLVNAKRFEDLHPSYKEDVSKLKQLNRLPASEDLKK
jgi:Zn-dependent protease with chaperone function